MPGVEHISLCRCRVLYLGSSIPLDTAVGIESIQSPCKDRYGNVDSDSRASGIDSVLSVYSSGLMLEYPGDQSTSTWFPIQTLHVCAAVKAVGAGNGPLRFMSLDTPAAQASNNPPLFACIMRRTKGIKVLECHVFICKSNQAAMALVQSCMHAFGHKEGWMDSAPLPSTRIVPDMEKGARRTGGAGGTARGGNLYKDRQDLVQKFDVSCRVSDQGGRGAYFSDWAACGGQPLMIIEGSPFYPGDAEMERYKRRRKKKKRVVNDCSDSDEETYYVRRSDLLGGAVCGGGVSVNIKKGSRKCCCDEYEDQPAGYLVYAPQYGDCGSGAVAVANAYASSTIYDPETIYNQGAEDQRRIQAAYDAGYCQAENDAYQDECGDEGYMEDYGAQPGYTDDGDQRGHFELAPYDDYLVRFSDGKKSRYVEVADGLGYYP